MAANPSEHAPDPGDAGHIWRALVVTTSRTADDGFRHEFQPPP
jgi:hypothetical protein